MKQKTPSVCGKTTKEMELMIYKRYIVTKKKSGGRESDPRDPPWQGGA